MAWTTTSQVIANGPRNLILKVTGLGDGTDQSGVKIVDATSATYAVTVQGQAFTPGTHLKLKRVLYDVHATIIRLQWEATANIDLATLSDNVGEQDWTAFQGIPNPKTTGATGSILLSTLNAALNSAYTLTLFMVKGVPQ